MAATTLRLYGPMGARFGRHHQFNLESGTVQEAIAALMSQVRGVREYLTVAKSKGIEFAIFVGKRNLCAEHLDLPASGEIRIAPVPVGAKRAGVLQTIVGIVLVVVGAYTHYTPLIQIGVSMIAGGVIQMLTPVPRGKSAQDGPGNTANYNFTGPINTQAQGNPVPLCYGGPMKVGSAVVSAGIDTNDTSTTNYYPGRGSMGGGGGPRTATVLLGDHY